MRAQKGSLEALASLNAEPGYHINPLPYTEMPASVWAEELIMRQTQTLRKHSFSFPRRHKICNQAPKQASI